MEGNESTLSSSELDDLLEALPPDESSSTFLELFRLNLKGAERLVFISFSSILILVGLCANMCIILAHILYRLHYGRENEFYSGRARTFSRVSLVGVNPFKVNITPENRYSYFNALSNQARFRYSHVILALAIFDLTSCIIFIPIAIINVCGGTPSANVDNWMVIICVAWSVFQILFTTVFFFVNTTIQFLSVLYPLTFKLRRSPLWITFSVIVIVCTIHAFLTVVVIFKQLHQTLFRIGSGGNNYELEKSIYRIQLLLSLPLTIFGFTWISTIVMYGMIIKHIHMARKAIPRSSLVSDNSRFSIGSATSPSQSSHWKKTVSKTLYKCLILGAGTSTFYFLEVPTFLVVYDFLSPSSWVLLAHFAVHAFTPLLHIMLSKSFRATLTGMLRSRRRRSSSSMGTLDSLGFITP